jgi:Domain of unknown function (DUF4432)
VPFVFGRSWSAEELRGRAGDLAQLAGISLATLAEGKARGMRVADVWTAGGLRFRVLLDRALDVHAAEHAGRPLAWVNPDLAGPEHYDPDGYGWLNTFGGGLVTTCGLTHYGQPEEGYGLHGRISNTRAEAVRLTQEWRGDDYVLEIAGQARETTAPGESLLLSRCITTRLGATSLTIEDTVRNEGSRLAPHMLLYHCNFGFPVVSPDSELVGNTGAVRPRDETAAAGLGRHRLFEPPQSEAPGEVFFHDPPPGPNGRVRVAIVNRALGFGAYVSYRAAELPCLTEWKRLSKGAYVCALEPGTNWEASRKKLEAEGRLRRLAPGEEVRYDLEIGALTSAEAIAAFEARRRTRGCGV